MKFLIGTRRPFVRAIQTVWTEARNDTRAPAEANGGASK